jgi:hypothetical protein
MIALPFCYFDTQAIVNGTAGDLILFDTALYHAGCPAEDPSGAGWNPPSPPPPHTHTTVFSDEMR